MTINSVNGNTVLETGVFPPCRAATTAAITLSGLQTVDGVALIAGDRVLAMFQADQTTNGIYAASSGNWVRSTDAAGNQQFFDGMAIIVAQGAVNGGHTFLCTCTDDPVIVGTSLLTFASQGSVAQATQAATSTTSLALTLGAKTLTIQSGKNFSAKQWVLIYETSNPDNNLLAEITSYVGTALAVSVAAIAGSGGPYTDWSVVLTNTSAAAGRQPPIGSGNMTGPGSSTVDHITTFADATGKVAKDSGITIGALAGRTTIQYGDAGAGSISAAALAAGAAPLPFVAVQPTSNLVVSNDGSNPTRDIGISIGRVRDDADITNLQLAGAMVKRLDLAWAAGGVSGAPAGALDSGSARLASKTYHAYLIGKLGQAVTQRSRSSNVATLTIATHGLGVGSTARVVGVGGGYDGAGPITAVTTNTISYANTGANEGATAVSGAVVDGFDVLASQHDVNAYPGPVLPSGWTVKQCLLSVLTDGGINNIAFTQLEDEVLYVTPITDVAAVAISSVSALKPLTVPLGVKVTAKIIASMATGLGGGSGNASIALYVTPPEVTDQAATLTLAVAAIDVGIAGGGTMSNLNAVGHCECRTDTSGRVRTIATTNPGSQTHTIVTRGYRDPRRRLF